MKLETKSEQLEPKPGQREAQQREYEKRLNRLGPCKVCGEVDEHIIHQQATVPSGRACHAFEPLELEQSAPAPAESLKPWTCIKGHRVTSEEASANAGVCPRCTVEELAGEGDPLSLEMLIGDDSFADDLLGLPTRPPRRRIAPRRTVRDSQAELWISEAERRMGFGRLGLAPIPFEKTIVMPGEHKRVSTMPQVTMGPPYRLSVVANGLDLCDLMIGNSTLLVAPGCLSFSSFQVGPGPEPLGLMLIDGPVAHLGTVLGLDVQNRTGEPLELEATLWGVPAWSRERQDDRMVAKVRELLAEARESGGPPKAQRCEQCHCYGTHSMHCPTLQRSRLTAARPPGGDRWASERERFVRQFQTLAGIAPDSLPGPDTWRQLGRLFEAAKLPAMSPERELYRARELLRARGELPPAPPSAAELDAERRKADRAATWSHIERVAPPAPDLSDSGAWSTATDES